MQLGQTIVTIRKENGMTQEEFAAKFHVTRQTVSNWENEKSYPDLLTLVKISDEFHCSLDTMLKENPKMIEKMNKDMKYGASSAYIGGICAIVLFIITAEMLMLDRGSRYILILNYIIIFANAEAVKLTFEQLKKESRRVKIFFAVFILLVALMSYGCLYYIC